ncbi:MAG: nucleotide exchange factor GrpE [Bacteroidetes bacterium]|nr:nucleotide exchange factor GrpE [Bacteroidota bacterium]HET6245783.1 nucleotide exchange factor GrpE [Bacteroidia bacterium]
MKSHEKTSKEDDLNQTDSHTEQESNTNTEENEGNGNVNDPQAKIKELEEKLVEQNDKFLRLYSEFDNYRKRTSKERIEVINTAGIEIISTLLPVVDDFERAIKSMDQASDIESIKEGIILIYNKLLHSLTRKGLEPMKTIGEPFDAELHEAITNIPAPSKDMVEKVVDEVEKGYLLNGKVIRYAKVVVGN